MDLIRYFALQHELEAGEINPAEEWRRILADADAGRHLSAGGLAAAVRVLGVPEGAPARYVERRISGQITRGRSRPAEWELYPPFLVEWWRRDFTRLRDVLSRLRRNNPDAYRRGAGEYADAGPEEAALQTVARAWEISPRTLWRLLHGRDDYRPG